jgi:two-component system LytT family response regulator
MITAILIDDEKNALEVLEWQLKNFCTDVQVLAMCTSADEAVTAIIQLQPQLIFLDIEMPVKSGFEVLNAFQQPRFDVIFTTAYNQFAIKAFKYAAFDYLLKPIDAADLKAAIERFKNRKTTLTTQQLEVLMNHMGKVPPPEKIALNTADGMMFIKPDQIIRCESQSNYTKIYLTTQQKVTIAKTLKDVEETLQEYHFYRIHNSHLINLQHIEKFVKADGGYVLMTDGEHITVARNRKDGFIEQFSKL